MTKITFISDTLKTVYLYRRRLLSALQQKNIQIQVQPIFSTVNLFKLMFISDFVSSNMKANIIMLSLNRGKGVIILNGFGRYQYNKRLRTFLITFMRLRKRNLYIVQNFRDYRYLRRYVDTKIYWVAGSGGSKRPNTNKENIVCVTRDGKIDLQLASLTSFLNSFEYDITFVGLSPQKLSSLDLDISLKSRLHNLGYVKQDEILLTAKAVLVIDGYGEGVPHYLVDAIASDIPIIISKQSLIKYGLYCFNHELKYLTDNWLYGQVNSAIKELVTIKADEKYLNIIMGLNSNEYLDNITEL